MNRKLAAVARSIQSADATRNASWRKQDLATIMLVWHIYKGGIWDYDRIREITGLKLHGSTIKSMVEGADILINGPHLLQQPVRCKECGAKIVQVPCPACGTRLLRGGRYRDLFPNPYSETLAR